MTLSPDQQKQALTKQVINDLESRLSSREAHVAARFAHLCLGRVPVEDLASEAPSTLATIVIRQLEFMRQRPPGEMLIRVYNPSMDVEGCESPHTIVEMINDDMPFLVDTGTLALAEIGLGIHLIIHPVIRVSRDRQGKLKALHDKKSGRGKAEAVIQFQVDRRADLQAAEDGQRQGFQRDVGAEAVRFGIQHGQAGTRYANAVAHARPCQVERAAGNLSEENILSSPPPQRCTEAIDELGADGIVSGTTGAGGARPENASPMRARGWRALVRCTPSAAGNALCRA
mgnify:CR=1 FL=1